MRVAPKTVTPKPRVGCGSRAVYVCVCLYTPPGMLLQSFPEAVASSDTTGPEKREKMLKTNEEVKRERGMGSNSLSTQFCVFFFFF